jgi:hypothetical protein
MQQMTGPGGMLSTMGAPGMGMGMGVQPGMGMGAPQPPMNPLAGLMGGM